ncbi:eCIS core domain-containing protein [Methanosarcina sp. Mfa9]|uniref:eCIS core domain-containing protein n=1 Tax=Methanosarcina sp. Mfa9 TaxID=3439063 RepID=UPI003F842740
MAERAVATAKAQESKQTCSNSCKQNIGFNSSGSPADMILQLQRTAGNHAVQRLIKSGALQAKLKIGQPNDIYEQEADRVAEQVIQQKQVLQKQVNQKHIVQQKPAMRQKKNKNVENKMKTHTIFSPLTTTNSDNVIQRNSGVCSVRNIDECSDEDLLTAICIGEAGNIRDRDGKKGVVHVVTNRLADSAFPATIRGVVSASGQFGGLNQGIRRLNNPAYLECRGIAREVFNNPHDDPTLGALWFNQSCSKPCYQYCTTYLGDGSSPAHYFARRATREERSNCRDRRRWPCCHYPRTRISHIRFTEREVEPILGQPRAEEVLRKQPEEKEELLQTKEISGQNSETTPDLESRINAVRGGGRPLPESERAFYEPRFGYDFSGVRVHTDAKAAESARAVNARAFTVGMDVAFGEGQYAPGTGDGQRLIAHELTHVVQQTGYYQGSQYRLQPAKAIGWKQNDSKYETEDALFYVKLALASAAMALNNDSFQASQKKKIVALAKKLNKALNQLQKTSGDDGRTVLDLNPVKNEIVPGDSNKGVEELFMGITPRGHSALRTEDRTSKKTAILQTKVLPGSLRITPLPQLSIQRVCDPVICPAIIILAGLLFSGCSKSSSKSCPKDKRISKSVHVFELAGRALDPKTEMGAAVKIWLDVAGILLEAHYHKPFDEVTTRSLIGLESSEKKLTVEHLELDYITDRGGTIEMKKLRMLREGDISIFFLPKLGYLFESAVDPYTRLNIAYIGKRSRYCPDTGHALAHEIGHLLVGVGHDWDSPLLRPSKKCEPKLTDLECRMARGDSSAWGEFFRQGGKL